MAEGGSFVFLYWNQRILSLFFYLVPCGLSDCPAEHKCMKNNDPAVDCDQQSNDDDCQCKSSTYTIYQFGLVYYLE